MKTKVLCIADSLALPGHLNSYEDTWICKMKEEFPSIDFITFFQRQLTTNVLVTMGGGLAGIDRLPKGADCLEMYNPEVVILQLGIVDCAPRLLSTLENRLLKLVPFMVSNAYVRAVKYLRTRKSANTLVSFEQFKNNLENYIKRCVKIGMGKLIILEIPYPDSRMVSSNPSIVLNIERYNSFIKDLTIKHEFVKTISVLDCRKYPNEIYQDGYHPNKEGHDLIFDALVKHLITV